MAKQKKDDTKELSTIEKALAEAAASPIETDKAYKKADSVQKIAERMGRGQPKKAEDEKATNKVLLYFNEAEIKDIENAAEINGFSKKDKNKYIKSIIRKMIRAELRQFG